MLILNTLLALVVIAIIDICIEVHLPKLHTQTITANKLPKGSEVRILHISDVHGKALNNASFVQQLRRTKPDFIVITGDLIDRHSKDLKESVNLVRTLFTFNREIFYVSGNHEWGNPLREDLIQLLQSHGIVVLSNEHVIREINGIHINFVGVEDPCTKKDDLARAMNGLNDQFYTLLLAHDPAIVMKQQVTSDLILSGHTHGGQIRLPIIGAIVAPTQGSFPTYDKGLYTLQPEQYLYIDSGYGTSTIPVRFLNRSQVSLVIVQNK